MDSTDARRLNTKIDEVGKNLIKTLERTTKALQDLGRQLAKDQHPAYLGMEPVLDGSIEPVYADVVKRDIPVVIDWWTETISATANVHKLRDGSLVIEVLIGLENAAQVEYEIEHQPVEALQISSVEPD